MKSKQRLIVLFGAMVALFMLLAVVPVFGATVPAEPVLDEVPFALVDRAVSEVSAPIDPAYTVAQ